MYKFYKCTALWNSTHYQTINHGASQLQQMFKVASIHLKPDGSPLHQILSNIT